MAGLSNLSNLSPLGNDQINSDFMSELSLDNSLIANTQESPILDSLSTDKLANELTSPPTKVYQTRMTNVGLQEGGEDGIGGIFNKVANTSQDGNKYSTVFRTINSPVFNNIISSGNLKNYGQGYPEKQSSVLQFTSTNNVPLQRYFEKGASDPNMEANWFFGGAQTNPIGGSVYPSFDPLTQGFTGYNNTTTPGVGSRTITINASDVKPNQLKDTSWESLYEPFHTSKGVGYTYGPNVSSDNLRLNYVPKHMAPNNVLFSQSTGDQPYVISKIGGRSNAEGDFETNVGISGRASREIPVLQSLVDVARLGKFIISQKGIAFTLKQNLLGMIGQQADKKFYFPLSTLAAVLRATGTVPIQNITRDFPFHKLNPTYTDANQPLESQALATNSSSPIRKNIGADNISEVNNVQKQIDGNDLHTNLGINKPFGTTTDLNSEVDKIESDNMGYPLYFKDLRTNQLISFRAYIEGLTENIAPSWSSEKYIGRSEPSYMYEMAERDISFTLKMFAMSSTELVRIYQKLNKLTSLAYPLYKYDTDTYEVNDDYTYNTFPDGNYDSKTAVPVPKNKAVPPLTKFRLGDLFGSQQKEVTGFIKSLSYSYPDQSPWEHRRGRRVPKHIVAAITYQVIHDSVPSWLHTVNSFGETFYGINQAEKNFGAAGTTDTTKKAFGVGTGDDGRKQT